MRILRLVRWEADFVADKTLCQNRTASRCCHGRCIHRQFTGSCSINAWAELFYVKILRTLSKLYGGKFERRMIMMEVATFGFQVLNES